MTDLCPSCREPVNYPSGDGCAAMTKHQPHQCHWCYSLIWGNGHCEQCDKDHKAGVQKGWMGSARRYGANKLDYQEDNHNEQFGRHEE